MNSGASADTPVALSSKINAPAILATRVMGFTPSFVVHPMMRKSSVPGAQTNRPDDAWPVSASLARVGSPAAFELLTTLSDRLGPFLGVSR
jgi:hypothetical protein